MLSVWFSGTKYIRIAMLPSARSTHSTCFIFQTEILNPLNNNSSHSLLPLFLTTTIPLSVSIWLWYHTSVNTAFVLLCLAHVTYYNVLSVHPCCGMCPDFLPFLGWIIFHCLCVPRFTHSFGDGHLGCFVFWIMLLWTQAHNYLFNSLSVLLVIKLPGHMMILFLIFWGSTIMFSIVAVPFYSPTNCAQVFQFLHIPSNTYFLKSFTLDKRNVN